MEIIMTAWQWFNRGGLVMYFLLLASIGAGAIIIERLRYYRHKQGHVHPQWQELKALLREKSIRELAGIYGKRHTNLDAMTAAAFKAMLREHDIEKALESTAQLEAAKLKKGLPLLGVLVTLAPILGLMGTVIGMIQSFSVFNLQAGAPMAITGGVGEALVATVCGLGVATLALLGHSYFGYRLDIMVTDMERWGSLLTEQLEGLQVTGKKERGQAKHEAA